MKNDKRLISIGEAAEYLGVSVMTLRRWDASGKLVALRRPSGHRYYDRETLKLFREDLFSIAQVWATSAVAPEIPKQYYSDTRDHFKARLERMAITMSQESTVSNLAPLITAVAGEIGGNSFDHNLGNWPDVPGIFFAYDINKRIIILADRGVGIKATLSRVCPDLKNDTDALTVALTKRVSGRSPEYRGNGLKFVVESAEKNSIEVSLQSGTALAIIGRKEEAQLRFLLADRNIRGVMTKIEY